MFGHFSALWINWSILDVDNDCKGTLFRIQDSVLNVKVMTVTGLVPPYRLMKEMRSVCWFEEYIAFSAYPRNTGFRLHINPKIPF